MLLPIDDTRLADRSHSSGIVHGGFRIASNIKPLSAPTDQSPKLVLGDRHGSTRVALSYGLAGTFFTAWI